MLLVDFMLVASGGVLIFRKDFQGIVRPNLEYGSNIWSVMYKKEAIQIENVQR
jgi:hypothetical protein